MRKRIILDIKRNNSLHGFFSKLLHFTLQEELLKFDDICVSWSLPKSNLETKIFKLEKTKSVFRKWNLFE